MKNITPMYLAVAAVVAAFGGVARGDEAADFTADAKLYYRVVACGNSDALPAGVDQAIVDKHCAVMAKRYADFQKSYAAPAEAFFAPLRPTDLPKTVVYPFGGGDLASALVTYPNATDITTISPRARRRSDAARQARQEQVARGARQLPRCDRWPARAARFDEREHAQARGRRHPPASSRSTSPA